MASAVWCRSWKTPARSAGLLTKEIHPESGTTTYTYDARGHVTKKVTPLATLTFAYDAAERLLTISDPTTVLKRFRYDEEHPGSQRWLGKLTTASRTNQQPVLGGDVVVAETFVYDAEGRISSKTTTTTGRPTFTDSYTYDALGNQETVTYPACSGCGAVSGPARTVQSVFGSDGLLTEVDGYTTASGIRYHNNGLLSSIEHENVGGSAGPKWTQSLDAYGMPRPGTIDVVNDCAGFVLQTDCH